MRTVAALVFLASLCAGFAGCSGSVGGPQRDSSGKPDDDDGSPSNRPAGSGGWGGLGGAAGASGSTPSACTLPAPRIVLLTPSQYEATAATLFPSLAERPAATLERTFGSVTGYSSNADVLRITTPHLTSLNETARKLAEGVEAPGWKHPCMLEVAPTTACVRDFVEAFGASAFRRPLSDDEQSRYETLHATLRKTNAAGGSLEFLVRAFLLSPRFLFRSELGDTTTSGPFDLTAHERASALSYTLSDGPPDAELLAAAERGALATSSGVSVQAKRLLASASSSGGLRSFFEEYLRYPDAAESPKSAKVLSDPSVLGEMVRETRAFIDHVLWQDAGTTKALFGADYSFASAKLASFYGIRGATAEAPQKVQLPSTRAGLLTHGSLLALHAGPDLTSAVHRGQFVRNQILCQPLPDPPPDANVTPLEDDGKSTARQRLAQHTDDPKCSACHGLMDPIGLAFETYDAAGRYRTAENDLRIETGVTLTGTSVDGRYEGPAELARALGGAPEVAACLAQQLLAHATARGIDVTRDACVLDSLAASPAVKAGNVRDIALTIVTSDVFLRRDPNGTSAPLTKDLP